MGGPPRTEAKASGSDLVKPEDAAVLPERWILAAVSRYGAAWLLDWSRDLQDSIDGDNAEDALLRQPPKLPVGLYRVSNVKTYEDDDNFEMWGDWKLICDAAVGGSSPSAQTADDAPGRPT